jgi:hypothetical protein
LALSGRCLTGFASTVRAGGRHAASNSTLRAAATPRCHFRLMPVERLRKSRSDHSGLSRNPCSRTWCNDVAAEVTRLGFCDTLFSLVTSAATLACIVTAKLTLDTYRGVKSREVEVRDRFALWERGPSRPHLFRIRAGRPTSQDYVSLPHAHGGPHKKAGLVSPAVLDPRSMRVT